MGGREGGRDQRYMYTATNGGEERTDGRKVVDGCLDGWMNEASRRAFAAAGWMIVPCCWRDDRKRGGGAGAVAGATPVLAPASPIFPDKQLFLLASPLREGGWPATAGTYCIPPIATRPRHPLSRAKLKRQNKIKFYLVFFFLVAIPPSLVGLVVCASVREGGGAIIGGPRCRFTCNQSNAITAATRSGAVAVVEM